MEYLFEKKIEVTIDVDFQKVYDLIKSENKDITDDDDIYTEFGNNEIYYLEKLFPDSGVDFYDEDNDLALDGMCSEFGKWLDNREK